MPSLGDCVRCLKRRRAATVERLSFGESSYKLPLCDEHADGFRDDMRRWTRVGVLDEGDQYRAFKSKSQPPARNLGRLVVSKLNIPEPAPAAPVEPAEEEAPRPRSSPRFDTQRPFNADQWVWSNHAVARATLRRLSEDEVLWCAERPDVVRPGKESGTLIHARGHVKVVLKPETREILTVADARYKDEEMELQDVTS